MDYVGHEISAELGFQPFGSSIGRNPLARSSRADVIEKIDGVSVEELMREFGSPLFVISEPMLRQRANAMRKAFSDRYAKFEFAWSFKTNLLDAVCMTMRSEGWLAEVVSSYEYAKARRLGYVGSQIIFNGPYKSDSSSRTALSEGALIQIDNWDELVALESIAKELGGKFDVGLRVMIQTGLTPTWSKFGFSVTNGEARQAAMRLVRNPNFRLHTLHSHIGTYVLNPQAYQVATQVLLGLREEIRQESGYLVGCLNLGGGFPSDSLLHGMPGPASRTIPRIDSYAEAITTPLNGLPARDRPVLRLETGRHLIDNAGFLLCTVVALKNQAHWAASKAGGVADKAILSPRPEAPVRPGYMVDAGINLLYTAVWFAIEATPAKVIDTPAESSRLIGDLCMEIDVIREHVMLPRLQTGDRLVLHPVGAYNINQSMAFIHLRPAIVMVDQSGGAHLIRRREQLDDARILEQLPQHFDQS